MSRVVFRDCCLLALVFLVVSTACTGRDSGSISSGGASAGSVGVTAGVAGTMGVAGSMNMGATTTNGSSAGGAETGGAVTGTMVTGTTVTGGAVTGGTVTGTTVTGTTVTGGALTGTTVTGTTVTGTTTAGGTGGSGTGPDTGQPADFTLKDLVTHTIAPSRFVDLGSGHYFVEFPKAAFGTVDITVTATSSRTVTLRFGEMKNGDAVVTNPGLDIQYASESLNVSAGTNTYRITQHPTVWAGGQPDKLFPTLSFRYVEILDFPGTLTEADISQIAVTYPFDDDASSFTSSDSTLNEVWELSKYTMKNCSWLGIYVDGTRERAPYEADAHVQQLGHYCQDTQAYAIARNTFRYFLDHPTWPAEWKFHSIFAAYAEYMWTGDTSFLSENWDRLRGKTLENHARSDGLVGPPGGGGAIAENSEIVDWPTPNRDSYDFGEYNAATNALYYKALVQMSTLASVLGNSSEATSYADKAAQVYESYQSVYYDSGRGAYRDSENSNHYAIHSSAFALAAGLVPEDRIAAVVSYVESLGMRTGVYGAQYLLEGIYNADEEDYALSLLAATGSRSWYDMIAKGSTVAMEAWPGYTSGNQGTWNHAWGAAPANLIPRCLMGIEPIGAAFSEIQIKPQIGALTSASVTVPTVKGSVSVSVTKGMAAYTITVTIPSGATGKVYVKDYNSLGTAVLVDGESQNGTAEGNYIVFDDVPSGTHTFEKAM